MEGGLYRLVIVMILCNGVSGEKYFNTFRDFSPAAGALDLSYDRAGLEGIYWVTRENRKISFYLEAWDGEVRTANYSTFYIDGRTTSYVLHAAGYSGDAGDSLLSGANHSGKPFSTKDRDNDASETMNCAVSYEGGFWYNSCHGVNLNGRYYQGGNYTEYATGASWSSWKGLYYIYKTIYMRLTH